MTGLDRQVASGDGAASERAFFDEFVATTGDFNPFTDRGWQVLARRFQEAIGPRQRLHLLDVGCGTGQSRRIYAAHVARYVGIDLSSQAIAMARSRLPQLEWHTADARALPFAPSSFDTVAFSSVLHHIPTFAGAVSEAYRVLRPGGMVFAFDPNLLNPAMALLRHPRSPLYLREGVSPNERPLYPMELRQAFRTAGFVTIRQRAQSGVTYRAVTPRSVNKLLGLFNAVDVMWERLGLGRILGTFILTWARKPLE